MSSFKTRISSSGLILWAVVMANSNICAQTVNHGSGPEGKNRSRIALSHVLPNLDGRHLKVTVVEVNYGPGESSLPHSHPCAVVGYVVEGTLRTQVKGEIEAVYKAGESFYEAPNGIHAISANASQTEPARLIAYFVCDYDAPLSVAASPSGTRRKK